MDLIPENSGTSFRLLYLVGFDYRGGQPDIFKVALKKLPVIAKSVDAGLLGHEHFIYLEISLLCMEHLRLVCLCPRV